MCPSLVEVKAKGKAYAQLTLEAVFWERAYANTIIAPFPSIISCPAVLIAMMLISETATSDGCLTKAPLSLRSQIIVFSPCYVDSLIVFVFFFLLRSDVFLKPVSYPLVLLYSLSLVKLWVNSRSSLQHSPWILICLVWMQSTFGVL